MVVCLVEANEEFSFSEKRILEALAEGPLQFTKLKEKVKAPNNDKLNKDLLSLREKNRVVREVDDGPPVRTFYRLKSKEQARRARAMGPKKRNEKEARMKQKVSGPRTPGPEGALQFETPKPPEPRPVPLLGAEDAERITREWLVSRHHNIFRLRFRSVKLIYDEWSVHANFEIRPLLVRAEHRSVFMVINATTGKISRVDEREDIWHNSI